MLPCRPIGSRAAAWPPTEVDAAYEVQAAAVSEMGDIEMLESDDKDPVIPRVLVGLFRKRAARRVNTMPRRSQRRTLTCREGLERPHYRLPCPPSPSLR